MAALFLSTTIHKIDKKGRVSVPASFRLVLSNESQPFQEFILYRSIDLPVLEGCSVERLQKLSNSMDQLTMFSDMQDDLTASIFADAHLLPFDQEGRVLIPKHLLSYAHITEHVAFVGRGASFQLWEPNAFTAHQAAARQRLRENKQSLSLTLKSEGVS